jgi:hypothetical protein
MYNEINNAQFTSRQQRLTAEAEAHRLVSEARRGDHTRPAARAVVSAAGRGLVRVGEWMQNQAGETDIHQSTDRTHLTTAVRSQ